jgi:prepilin-type N-terminal cleavage/methylation domain-containing protein
MKMSETHHSRNFLTYLLKEKYSLRISFTLIEVIMVTVIIGMIAVIAVPKMISFREEACSAANEGNIGALRSAISIYYARSALYPCLCLAKTEPGSCNPYRLFTVPSPCYPSGITELESLLTSSPTWCGEGGVACYDDTTGTIVQCP